MTDKAEAVAELIATAAIGRDADEWIKSDLGQVVLGIARQEAEAATEKLKRTSAWRRRRITQLQAEIWRAESFERWLTELMAEGEQALHRLEYEE